MLKAMLNLMRTSPGVIMNKLFLLVAFWLISPTLLAIPAIQHWTTGNGARVYFTQATEIPMVDVRVVFDAGSARDDGLAGVAALTNSLLSEGAGKLDANMIADRLDGLGAQLGSGSLRDMAWLSVRTLSDEKVLRDTMGLLALILAEPTFEQSNFERLRKRMLVGYQASLQQPSKLAEKAFMQAVYGDHPYASPPEGTDESLNKITRQQVRDFYQRYYVASNAVITIVGDLPRLKAEALAEVLSSGMRQGNKAPALPAVKPVESKTVRVTHPSTQTHLWVGQPGMKRGDPDYFALYVGNHTLGGSGLVSILSDEVREKRGFAYSAYSYFSPMRELGPFKMALQTKNLHAVEALKVMRESAQDFIDTGITAEQLKASKQNIIGGFALNLDSNSKLAQNLAMIGFYGLPLDYLNNFIGNIEKVSMSDVKDAFKRRVKLDEMITVIVGPEQLQSANN